MWDRIVEAAPQGAAEGALHLLAQIPAALLGAALTLAASISWFAGESWTEDKVDEGVEAHEARVEPRLERIEANGRHVRDRQAEFRRDIDVIKSMIEDSVEHERRTRESFEARSDRLERLVERLVEREMGPSR